MPIVREVVSINERGNREATPFAPTRRGSVLFRTLVLVVVQLFAGHYRPLYARRPVVDDQPSPDWSCSDGPSDRDCPRDADSCSGHDSPPYGHGWVHPMAPNPTRSISGFTCENTSVGFSRSKRPYTPLLVCAVLAVWPLAAWGGWGLA